MLNKRCFFVALLLGTGLLATSCSQVSQGQPASVVDKIRATHVLKAAYIVYPPFVYKDPNSGSLSGYFIDLMNQVAAFGDFKMDYEEAKWSTMVSGLESKRYDIVVSGIFPTIPRSFSVAFAKPIMYVGLGAVVPASDTTDWTPEKLAKPGLRIAVVSGEVGHEYVKRVLPDAKPTVLDTADISRAAAEVAYGRADIAISESITASEFASQNPKVKAVFVRNPLEIFGSTVMVRRGDPDWLNFLNTAIDFLEASGNLQRLEAKYKIRPDMWKSRQLPWQLQ
jgi:ABC-type amino acid transport substrate-binding protein